MKVKVNSLMAHLTWKMTPIQEATRVIKSTWVFKRLPDGMSLKFKARLCVRGDLQREGVDYFEMYFPVIQWSTIRMLLLAVVLRGGWATRQMDYTNTFAQAESNETVNRIR
jgi:hypothetical protein